ncbi:unnamed protein product [Microthlaspi erraticum]|uniref:NYN domain-containing protein n=1 Tax=Microthlaspi erraticum TaxID=1685480 RepID=A0A6D2IMP0_9BRAS|nr:unnamed protein product [Microthlaspi erraticum]
MMQNNNKSSAQKTGVWWDMETCQVPRGYDPYHVRQTIESALKEYLPFTISAFGNLKRVAPRVLVPLFSTGIHMKHVINGSADIASDMLTWARNNPPPATLILISDHEEAYVASGVIPELRDRGYTILRVFGNLPKFSPNYYQQTRLWKHLFSGVLNMDSGSEDGKQEKVVTERCSGTGWICQLCFVTDSDEPIAGESFESLISHFKSLEHAFQEWSSVPRHVSCYEGVTSEASLKADVPLFSYFVRASNVNVSISKADPLLSFFSSQDWSLVPGNWPIKIKKHTKASLNSEF